MDRRQMHCSHAHSIGTLSLETHLVSEELVVVGLLQIELHIYARA